MLITILKLGIIILAGAWIGLALFAWIFANRLIFPAPPASYGAGPDIRMVRFAANEPPVATLYLPVKNPKCLLFYHHGNGEDLGGILPRLKTFQRRGYAVFAWDYPGYGMSPGKPDESIIYRAAEGLWDFLVKEMGVPEDKIIHYGRSIGGGPATWLASRKPGGGVVLEGSFTSTFRVFTPWKVLPWDVFDNLDRIGNIDAPVWLIHGTEDQTVGFWHSKRLYEKARDPKQFTWIEGGGHNNLIEDYGGIYWDGLERFLELGIKN